MSQRPLAIVSGLTIGDYLLWNWSLNHSHDVLALISGLTLPPLVLVCAWLLVVSAARLLARATRRPVASPGTARPGTARRRTFRLRHPRLASAKARRAAATRTSHPVQRAPGSPSSQAPASTATTGPSRKLAA